MDNRRILIVEDSHSVARLLKVSLEAVPGFQALNAYSLAEALDTIDRNGDFFLAVLDMHLPDASGEEIVNKVMSRGIPVIIYTSDFTPDLRKRMLGKGIIDYVIKSGNTVMALASMIERLHRNTFLKVLVVDDSFQFRKYMRKLLTRQMLTVLEASSGEKALEVLDAEPEICLIFTDFEMEGMDGTVLSHRIRDKYGWGEKAVIGLSSGEEGTSVKFIKGGAHDFLPKTFEYEELYWRTRQNLEHLERIRELRDLNELKNRILGMVAHDLRNPIGSIKGYSQLLRKGIVGKVNEEQKNFLEAIHNTSSHMLALVNDLLDVSALESGKIDLVLDDCDVSALVEEEVRLYRVMAEPKNIRIDFSSLGPVPCIADLNRLPQVISNLLSNAVKYSPLGSTVHVSLGLDGQDVVFCVKDEGPGIPSDELDRLFKPFERLSTKPTGGEKSTGLGLAIVHDIVRAHDGDVWVESKQDQGTSFFFSLPCPSAD
ncbi:MAG: response regulator [Desulfovibrio sp.]|uniref:sensor histidine kinase n=1 Tax=Desulfovibrio sp. 7SRBS1 TaxID=3378064 RepID=UPI003B3E7F9E